MCCPKKVEMTPNKLRLVLASVYQMKFVQSVCLFLLISLELSGYINYDNLGFESGYVYLQGLIGLSFIMAIWAMFLLFGMAGEHELLREDGFGKKADTFKLLVILINVQEFVFEAMAAFGLLPCDQYFSRAAYAAVIHDSFCLVESFALGQICFVLNYFDFKISTL